jgi:hypothetical protein
MTDNEIFENSILSNRSELILDIHAIDCNFAAEIDETESVMGAEKEDGRDRVISGDMLNQSLINNPKDFPDRAPSSR